MKPAAAPVARHRCRGCPEIARRAGRAHSRVVPGSATTISILRKAGLGVPETVSRHTKRAPACSASPSRSPAPATARRAARPRAGSARPTAPACAASAGSRRRPIARPPRMPAASATARMASATRISTSVKPRARDLHAVQRIAGDDQGPCGGGEQERVGLVASAGTERKDRRRRRPARPRTTPASTDDSGGQRARRENVVVAHGESTGRRRRGARSGTRCLRPKRPASRFATARAPRRARARRRGASLRVPWRAGRRRRD